MTLTAQSSRRYRVNSYVSFCARFRQRRIGCFRRQSGHKELGALARKFLLPNRMLLQIDGMIVKGHNRLQTNSSF